MSKSTTSLIALTIGLVLFLAVNALAANALRFLRIDLTEESVFTLSEGSRNIAASLDEPLQIYLYRSEDPLAERPDLLSWADHVQEKLEEFARHADGNIELRVVDPEPFSEAEDEAALAGLERIPLSEAADPLVLGVVISGSTDEREVIPFVSPAREQFLEYDLAERILAASQPERTVVGLLSSLPIAGDPMARMMGQPGPPAWLIMQLLERSYEVRQLQPGLTEIPEDVDTLWVVHPQGFSDETLYAIDQFVLAGKPLLAMVDPQSVIQQVPQDPQNPMAGMMADRSSNMPALMSAWGLEVETETMVGDRENARITYTSQQSAETAPVVFLLDFDQEAFDEEDAVTSELSSLFFYSAGAVRPAPGSTTEFVPLVRTSDEATELDKMQVQFMQDPSELLTDYQPGNERLAIAARVSGPANTAFPDGPPSAPEAEGEEAAPAEIPASHRAASDGSIQVAVIADTDFLYDDFWVRRQFGMAIPSNDNGNLVQNLLDTLSGGTDLISIRSRGTMQRPFDRVDDLRAEAHERYQEEEQALDAELEETMAEINRLQGEKSESQMFVLSEAQQDQIAELREAERDIRKRKREVRHNLAKDIESLGRRVKWANMLLYPLGVGGLFFGFLLVRVLGRR